MQLCAIKKFSSLHLFNTEFFLKSKSYDNIQCTLIKEIENFVNQWMDKRFDSQWWCVDNYSKDNYRVEFFPLQLSPVQQHGIDNVGSPGSLSVGGVDEHCILEKQI